ncbi:hypothetical protein G7Y89_g12237 [Cudoniella acicularis]|uniref:GTP cyclohydrolase II domain-containing protein n=1 Tax=Cudoniella acicularis TaxID=354080 RepID=A0A8H4R9F0_9HELO|nr:hypothetical protein G7Y89_g12237 [Cudoniella acicularis]
MPDLDASPSHPSSWNPTHNDESDVVPQLPPFYSPQPIPVSRAISELDLNSLSISHPAIDSHLSSVDSHSESEQESALPGLVSPAFTPPSTPGASTPSYRSSVQHIPKSIPVDSSVANGGCGQKKPKLLEKLPEVSCVVRARIPTTIGGMEMFLHLYTNSEDNKEHLAIVFGNSIRSRSLDRPREGETELDRLIRGAYTGRLYPGRTSSKMPERANGAAKGTPEVDGSAEEQKKDPPLVRIHSECYTGETVWSARCDCGEQLDEAARLMSLPGSGGGIIIYLRQEGRGIGLGEKLKAYNLQDLGSDTVEANLLLRHPADARSYGLATAMLRDLGQQDIRLLTNNPDKVRAVEGPNREIVVKERVAMIPLAWRGKSGGIRSQEVGGYLKTKIEKMGHIYSTPKAEKYTATMAELENGLERHRSTVEEKDEEVLAEFGYKQELRRDWGLLHNFGISFSIISVITGITTLFEYGLTTGGPGVMSVGWIVVSVFTMAVAMSMAEIVSAIPTAGGPYYWSAMLAPSKHSAFASWITGWFNFLGQVAVTTGISFGLAGLISTTATVKSSYVATPGKTIGIYAAVLISQGIVNTFGVHVLRYLNNTSILLHSAGVTALAIAVLAKAPTHQSAKFVFATFNDGTAATASDVGWATRASPAYVACLGALMSQYTLTGFDASAHLSEETKKASWSAPIGVISSVGFSSIFGFFVLLSFLFSIQNFENTVGSTYSQPVLQILVDVFGDDGAVVLMCLIMICVWHCGLFSLTSNSRMMFAFARDGGIPHFFHKVDAKLKSPIRTVWLAAFLAFCLALPSLGSPVAFAAATSIATIGLYISYGIPILIGLIYYKDFNTRKGPFNLRMFSRPVAFVSVSWICFITIIFCLPTVNPVSSQTLNYTVVAVGIIAIGSMGVWIITARKWFVGPLKEVKEAERLGVDLEEPGELEAAEELAAKGEAEKGVEASSGEKL